ncbi:RNA-binding protein [Paraburkholderia bannensis]|uniref:RNA-binding protein n=1 Tax=Paraburkholderia bannensis TaxID=765414 RepID=UPI002AB7C9F7|nr:RNA-binding protein [Paraburkholderia bannensis]
MAELLLGNVEEDTPDEEINAFLQKYGFPPYDEIQRIEGAGRPAALLKYTHLTDDFLRTLQPRIHNIFWHNRTISAQVVPVREEG